MNYQEILKLVEYPETCLVIDFETFYDQEYSLGKLSTIEYICHRMFDFTGIGWWYFPHDKGSESNFCFKPDINEIINMFQNQFGKNLEKVTVIAKNCKFDVTILVEKFGIHPSYVIDIDDLLRHYDSRMSHKMKDVTKMFGLQSKGNTTQFKGLHYGQMDNQKRVELQSYALTDISIETELFKILLPLLSNPNVEIPLARHTLDLYLLPRIKFDFQKAVELQEKMQKKIDAVVVETRVSKKDLSGDLSFVALLKDALPENESIPTKYGKPGKKMIKLLGQTGMIPALAQQDDGCKWLLAHSKLRVQQLMKARQIIKSWPLHIKRIENMTNQAIVTGGKLRVPLHYYGGHTGRWSGGEKINLQNLGGRGRTGAGIDPLISSMRSLLCAPDMFTFPIIDSAQIEARLLAWIAGQGDLLQEFAEGKSPYCTFATKLFKEKVWKPTPEEKKTPEGQKVSIKYGFGKDSILGCGYGMGANTFYQNCIQNPGLRPLFDSGEYDFRFIKNLIDTYRTIYDRIPAFWRSIEKAFKWVIKYPHETIWLSQNNLTLWKQETTVYLQLPSGRCLTYRHARIDSKGTICWHHGKLWGGSITENIIQAIARDLLGYWILEFEKNHLQVVHHSHDEIISLVRENDMAALPKAIELMSQGPDWAEGLPLAAEGELSRCYKK